MQREKVHVQVEPTYINKEEKKKGKRNKKQNLFSDLYQLCGSEMYHTFTFSFCENWGTYSGYLPNINKIILVRCKY